MKITKVYTKTGDEGMTTLIGGVKVRKTNSRIEAYGTVDELSAHLGWLATYMKDGDDKKLLLKVQNNLFVVGAYLATDKSQTPLAPSYTLDPDAVEALEQRIDAILDAIPQQTDFILPAERMPQPRPTCAARCAAGQSAGYSFWARQPSWTSKCCNTLTDCLIICLSLQEN